MDLNNPVIKSWILKIVGSIAIWGAGYLAKRGVDLPTDAIANVLLGIVTFAGLAISAYAHKKALNTPTPNAVININPVTKTTDGGKA